MSRTTTQGNSALIPADAVLCDVASDRKAAKALEGIKAKYAHALTENVWRHEKKIGVLISCTVPGCSAQRFLHSSDLWHCDTCPDHKKGATKPVAPKTEKAAGKRVRSKDAPKAARKRSKAGKAAPRTRKGKRIRTRAQFVAAATGKGE